MVLGISQLVFGFCICCMFLCHDIIVVFCSLIDKISRDSLLVGIALKMNRVVSISYPVIAFTVTGLICSCYSLQNTRPIMAGQ